MEFMRCEQIAQRSLEEEAKMTSILQEQQALLKTRLEEAYAASAQDHTSDNNEVRIFVQINLVRTDDSHSRRVIYVAD